ncbi:MAG: (2Fe-2S)-binding protein [Chloroflexi bacterium]|nr:(2Fe-2S)-binding protein [Chloroflexota bacterium]MCL5076465.1 (2Fe-2S)-binding protein [Chloroflexota bacterium]
MKIELTVNGHRHILEISPTDTLLRVIREQLHLSGTKVGCEEGDCGACTVLIDGQAVNSCLVLAAQADGCSILTIEGLGSATRLHPLQESFVRYGAVQCGYCTPGMLLSAKALLDRYPNPSRQMIREAISGNLCRCTGYMRIIEAIEAVARGEFSLDESGDG